MMRFTPFLCLFVVMTAIHFGSCNQMDPHVFPTTGPYFEGWAALLGGDNYTMTMLALSDGLGGNRYMRVIDHSKGVSLGWIFSLIRPEGQNHSTHSFYSDSFGNYPHPIMITHLVSASASSKLTESHMLLPADGFVLTKNGQPIVTNPDDPSPAEFEAKMGEHINFIVRPNGTTFSITVNDAIFKGETASPLPWGPHGEGPESWLENLPLPLHWFVYSLRSDVKYYEYTNNKTKQVIKGSSQLGKPVVAHMEKDWGGAFPKAWIWAEGVNPNNNVSFAISSGVLHELIVNVKAQLSGYKNPGKNIDCKFHPLNSIHVLKQDGCKGYAHLEVESVDCTVVFDISVDPKLLSSCLITPQVYGYDLGCVESYNGVANITVFERHGLEKVQTDSQIIKMAALEFGGAYMCNGKCP